MELASEASSLRNLAKRFNLTPAAINRHKAHVNDKLATIFEEERRDEFAFCVETFVRSLRSVRKALDAYDEWHQDPDAPEKYDIGPRAEEVTVKYDDFNELNEQGKPTKKKAKLGMLLQAAEKVHNARVTGFEYKFSDPRKLLLETSNAIDSKLQRFMEAWDRKQERERQEAEKAASREEADAGVAELLNVAFFRRCLDGLLEGELADSVAGYLATQAPKVLAEEE